MGGNEQFIINTIDRSVYLGSYNIHSSFWNVSETGFVITIYLADKIPFKRLFHGDGDGLCVFLLPCIIDWLLPTEHLLYIKYFSPSTHMHPEATPSPLI